MTRPYQTVVYGAVGQVAQVVKSMAPSASTQVR
jgi:hypothetical protein